MSLPRSLLGTFTSQETLVSRLTAIFALLAVLLAAIGLYGVMRDLNNLHYPRSEEFWAFDTIPSCKDLVLVALASGKYMPHG